MVSSWHSNEKHPLTTKIAIKNPLTKPIIVEKIGQ